MQSEPWSEMLSCRFLSDLISDGFLVLDERLAVYHVNSVFAEMIGYSKTDIQSHSLTEFVHKSSREIIEATIRESSDEHVSSLDIDWVSISGNLVPTTVQVGSVADSGNQTRWGFILVNAQPTSDQPLTEDEARYRLVFENLADGVFQTDEDGIITMSTAKGAEIFGYSVSELEGRNFGVLVHPDDLPVLIHAFGESRDRLEALPGGIEAKGVRKDGSIIHFHITNSVLLKDGEFRGFQSLLRDVTDRVEAFDDLRESEERFALFAENIPGPVFIKDKDSNMLYANSFMRERFGRDDWAGKNTLELFPKEYAERMLADDAKALLEGPVQILQRVPDKHGNLNSYRTSKFPIRREGKPTLLGGVAFDVTDIDRAESALRESEEQYRTTLLAIGDPIHVVDRDLKILLCNPVLEKWLEELDLDEEVVGRRLDDIFSFLPENVLDEYDTVFQSGETLVSEERTLLGGREIFTEVTKVPIFQEGQVQQVLTIVRDVSEDRIAEMALRNSEMKYKQLVEQYTQGIAIIEGPPLRIPFANRALGAILEMDPEDVERMTPEQVQGVIHPDDFEYSLTRFTDLMSGSPPGDVPREFRIVRPSGEVRVVAALGRRVEYQGKHAIQMAIEDVTDRIRAEQELRQSEERYRKLVEESLQGLAVIQDGRYMYVNPAFAETLGYSVEDLLQFSADDVWNLIHPDDRDELERRNEAIAAGASITPRHKFRYLGEDGSARYVESFVRQIMHEGRPAMQVMDLDVTERMRSERALRESEAKYRQLVEQSPLGIVIVRGLPIEIVFANNAMVRISGHPLSKLLSMSEKDIEGLIHPDDYESIIELFSRVLGGEPPLDHPIVMRVIRSDGKMVWVEAVGHRIEYEDSIALQATIVDISERLIAERERERAELELKTAAETSMLYLDLLGHDMRNKLQGIQMAIELMQFDETRPEAFGAIERIMDLVETAEALIDKAHATRGLLTAPLEMTSLKDALVASIGALRFRHENVIAEVAYHVDEANVKADEYVGHLLTNVLENAILHNPAETKRVWVTLKEGKGGYEVSIADDGAGIDDAKKASLFDQDRRYGGLGLHQARRILAKYGGTMEVTDRVKGEPEKGARFNLWFPRPTP